MKNKISDDKRNHEPQPSCSIIMNKVSYNIIFVVAISRCGNNNNNNNNTIILTEENNNNSVRVIIRPLYMWNLNKNAINA